MRAPLLPEGFEDRGHLGAGGMGEVRLVFEELMKRIDRLEPAGDIAHLRSNFIAGIKRMPVRVVA